jgi:hypothetical protein
MNRHRLIWQICSFQEAASLIASEKKKSTIPTEGSAQYDSVDTRYAYVNFKNGWVEWPYTGTCATVARDVKRPIHIQLNWAILLCDAVPNRKTE